MDRSKDKVKFPDLHVHTGEGSLRDTGSLSAELVNRAAELGATAMAMTDHGTLAATQPFRVACEKAGIKPIYGCEFYVDVGDGNRTHFVVLAKNNDGYQAISKVCTATASNMHDNRPIATLDMFKEWFGIDGIGYGNVIATSACIQGPLCSKILQNSVYDMKIAKIERKRSRETNSDDAVYKEAMRQLAALEEELATIKTEKDAVFALAKTTYKKELNKAYRSEDAELIKAAEELKQRVEDAIANKTKVKNKETKKAAEIKKLKETISPMVKSVERYIKYSNDIQELEDKKVSKEKAASDAVEMLQELQGIFHKDDFYIELQNHGMEEEKYAMSIVAQIARDYAVPVVATNDVHYATRDRAEARQYNFSQYRDYFWKDMEPQDWELYIKDNEEMTEWLCRILPDDIVEEAIENTYKIADMCNVEFDLDAKHYPKFPCKEGAKLHLRALITQGKSKVPTWTADYQKRVERELKVIESMGFSDYLCIVADFLNYARLVGKIDLNNPEFLADPFNIPLLKRLAEGCVGEGCGPGRGSAAGSLICYLVGITNIDPMVDDLLFERFLNPERVSMPDIDSDIAPNVRPFVIDYLKNKYGEKSVCQIMTFSFFGIKSSIQAAARVMGRRAGDEKAYLNLASIISKSLEIDSPKLEISDMEDTILATSDEAVKSGYTEGDIQEIVKIAKMLEGLVSGYGTHAAGIIISDNNDVSDYVPLINVSGAIDCQVDLNWVEKIGMLKLDLLGLRNLGIITECERAVQKELGINLSINEFPVVPEVFSEIFAQGMTDGIFQFESDGMKNTLTNFGPDSIADLTLLNAVYRPGPLQYIDDITAVKKGEKTPRYIIPEMEEILGATYGKPVYQEQIMSIFNKIAGFSLGESDIIRRLMSKKKTEEFAKYKDRFINGLVSRKASRRDAESFWDELVNFSEYAFNKSHARAYSEVAYATAYLKYQYPDAYACGLLSYTSNDKMPKIILDTKNQGTSVKCPDVNFGGVGFTLCGSDVLFGLKSVPQISGSAEMIVAERIANGKYTSFKDFLTRLPLKKNVLTNLIYSGALDCFGNREAMAVAAPNLLDLLKAIKDKKAIVEAEGDSNRGKRAKESLEKLIAEFEDTELEEVSYSTIDLLNKEKALLGQYISAHPMDGIVVSNPISSLITGQFCNITALTTDFQVIVTKAGRQMIRLTVSDKTDFLDAVMFPDAYDKYGDIIKESAIFRLNGILKVDDNGRKQFIINKVFPFKMKEMPIHLRAPKGADIEESIKKRIAMFKDTNSGCPLDIYNSDTGKVEKVSFPVDKEIRKKEILWIMKG